MTYSIVAYDKKTNTLGVAVASGSIAVGARVPWIKANVGAIATQAYTNTIYGSEGLKLLEKGYSPKEVLKIIQEQDPEYQYRQVAIIDTKNRKAVFTGDMCPEWKGQHIGEYYIVIGNLILGPEIIERIKAIMDKQESNLILRLLTALVAAEEAGGDRRGNRSAAIMIAGQVNIKLRVDDSKNPARKLHNIFYEKYGKTSFL